MLRHKQRWNIQDTTSRSHWHMKQLNAVTGGGTRHGNMNCDTGNKTQVFHKARRRSCSEQDNMRSKPLRGIHVSLFARRRKQAANKEADVATRMCGRDVGSWLWGFFRERAENTRFPWFEHEKTRKEIGWGHGATAACALECVHELPGTCFSIYMCWLVDRRGMREELNGGDGWSGGSVTHFGLGFFLFFFPGRRRVPRYEKLVSHGPLLNEWIRPSPEARSKQSVTRKQHHPQSTLLLSLKICRMKKKKKKKKSGEYS